MFNIKVKMIKGKYNSNQRGKTERGESVKRGTYSTFENLKTSENYKKYAFHSMWETKSGLILT